MIACPELALRENEDDVDFGLDSHVDPDLLDSQIGSLISASNPKSTRNNGSRDLIINLLDELYRLFFEVQDEDRSFVLAKRIQQLTHAFQEIALKIVRTKVLKKLKVSATMNPKGLHRISYVCRLLSLIYSLTDYGHPLATPIMNRLSLILRISAFNLVSDDQYRKCGIYALATILKIVHPPRRFMPYIYQFLKSFFAAYPSIDEKYLSKVRGLSALAFECISDCGVVSERFLSPFTTIPSLIPIVPQIEHYHEPDKPIKAVADNYRGIQMFTPKIKRSFRPFEAGYQATDREYDQAARRRYKRELRSTARQIKRDSELVGKMQLDKQRRMDEERNAKVKRIMADLADQEGDYRKTSNKRVKF
ncbi:hypothetical protein ACOME3_003064 [Neoechinorhynchus agilis]